MLKVKGSGKSNYKAWFLEKSALIEIVKNFASYTTTEKSRFSATAVSVVCPGFQNEMKIGKGAILVIQVRK